MVEYHVETGHGAIGKAAAGLGGDAIHSAIEAKGGATIVLATGASQFDVLAALVQKRDIDWSRVMAFHLDEYIGLPDSHPASFRHYLRQRFTAVLPTLGGFCGIAGDAAISRARWRASAR